MNNKLNFYNFISLLQFILIENNQNNNKKQSQKYLWLIHEFLFIIIIIINIIKKDVENIYDNKVCCLVL